MGQGIRLYGRVCRDQCSGHHGMDDLATGNKRLFLLSNLIIATVFPCELMLEVKDTSSTYVLVSEVTFSLNIVIFSSSERSEKMLKNCIENSTSHC